MGRPSREEAERIGEAILAAATERFLANGYGATSIEAIAQDLGIAKRTFYSRFKDKATLFEAVVHHIVGRLKPPDMAHLFHGGTLEEILLRVGELALQAAISPEALALQSLVLAESSRFPELAGIALGEGTRQQAIAALARLLADPLPPEEARFAAAQFLQMVISLPQHSALGIAPPMSPEDHRLWVRRTVSLFLDGCRHWETFLPGPGGNFADPGALAIRGHRITDQRIQTRRTAHMATTQPTNQDTLKAKETYSLIAADKVEGTTVYDAKGEKLGSIHRIMINKASGRVTYAVMSFGGFLGIGGKYHPLPWSLLTFDERLGGYIVNLDRQRIENAPAYSEDELAWNDPKFGAGVTDYYGPFVH